MAVTGKKSRHLPALDGIRALAAAVIVLYHARLPSLPGGFLAVDIFFVLSGFLITRGLLASFSQGNFSYRQFCLRRLRRLWPALLVFLLVYLITAPLVFDPFPFSRHLHDVLLTAVYVVNYASVFSQGIAVLGHVWTLAVEMQFYLIWPVVVILLVRLPERRLALVALAGLFILATASRWWQATPDNPWGFYIHGRPGQRTDSGCSVGFYPGQDRPILVGGCFAASGFCHDLLQHSLDTQRPLWLHIG